MTLLTGSEAILRAQRAVLETNTNSVLMGLGVNDPKRVFGTTSGLVEQFGVERIVEIPLSEAAMTGVALGAALNGNSVIFVHQRADFSLVSAEMIINQVAKWRYLSGYQDSIPLVIRLIVGRGWGQGPTHGQSLQALYSTVPGLLVLSPTVPQDLADCLVQGLAAPDPCLIFEHRWLHQLVGDVKDPTGNGTVPGNRVVRTGKDVTLVSFSYETIEALKACDFMMKLGIECELIDLVRLSPLDLTKVKKSVKKTRKLIFVDGGNLEHGIGAEVVASLISEYEFDTPPMRLGQQQTPLPSSLYLAENYYPSAHSIAASVAQIFNLELTFEDESALATLSYSDVPGEAWKGPF